MPMNIPFPLKYAVAHTTIFEGLSGALDLYHRALVVVCHESNIFMTSRSERVAAMVNVMLCEPDRCVLCRQFANDGSIISTTS